MDAGLGGRAVVVTGGGSGIGLACASALVDEGARVIVLDRNPESGAAVSAAGADLVSVDVRDEAALQTAIETSVARLGGLDVLVCCAGISGPFGSPIEWVAADEWDDVMAINVRGAFLAAKHSIPHLRQRPSPSIVLLASDSGHVAAPGMAPYCASKGALLSLGRALSVDLAADGIRVNCVSPSIVDTPMARDDLERPDGFADEPFPVQTPAEVARLVVFLASPLASTVNGTTLVADFGFLARSAFPA